MGSGVRLGEAAAAVGGRVPAVGWAASESFSGVHVSAVGLGADGTRRLWTVACRWMACMRSMVCVWTV